MWKLSQLGNEEDKLKFELIVDMGLSWSTMMRVFEEKTKRKLQRKIVLDFAERIFNVGSKESFVEVHSDFCDWGIRNVNQAVTVHNPYKISASYGQIAKTLDVTLKVAIYYCHLPDILRSEKLSHWLNAAVDTAMMHKHEEFRKTHHQELPPLPSTLKEVKKSDYENIQELVRKSIQQEYGIMALSCPQWEDVNWAKANEYEHILLSVT